MAIALDQAVRDMDLRRAHRLACDLRDLGWSAALPGLGATTGVLTTRLTDPWASLEDIHGTLDQVYIELHKATT